MRMSRTTSRNRRYDSSTDSESDDSDDKYVTGDRQIISIERQNEISFLGRGKVAHHEKVKFIELSDPTFDRLSNYRYYLRMNTCHVCLAEECMKFREERKTFQTTCENTKLGGDYSFLISDLSPHLSEKPILSAYQMLMYF